MIKTLLTCFVFLAFHQISAAQAMKEVYAAKSGEQIILETDRPGNAPMFYYYNPKVGKKLLEFVKPVGNDQIAHFRFANVKDKNVYQFKIEDDGGGSPSAFVRINPDKSTTRFKKVE